MKYGFHKLKPSKQKAKGMDMDGMDFDEEMN
jgi:hypothetical protein